MTQKLLLAALGIPNDAVRTALVDLLGKPIEESNALFVPTAMMGFPGADKFVGDMVDRYIHLGWNRFHTLDLHSLAHWPKALLRRDLDETDALIVGGGNEFYLSYWMQQSGLFDLLPKWLEQGKVYVGESAGSMVVTAALNYDRERLERESYYHDDQYDEGQLKESGSARTLGLVDFIIRPHIQTDVFPQATLENVAQWAAKAGRPCYALDDQSALKIVDGKVEVVSQGEWKFFDAA